MRHWTSLAAAVALSTAGCVPRSQDAAYAGPGPISPTYGAYGNLVPYAPPPYPTWQIPPAPPMWTPVSAPEQPMPAGYAGARIPGGERCVAELDRLGIAYGRLESVKGVTTPIRITGPIGGIRYKAVAGLPFVSDCRLAVALFWSSPDLTALGIQELRYSGVYVDRTTRRGKPSLHARGLAIDLHAAQIGGQVLSVKHDFRRGLADGCAAGNPALNQLACRLRTRGLFKQLLTPDTNADHHDHLHLGVAPID